MRYVNWEQAKRAVPPLFILTLIVDMLVLRVTEQPASALELVFWTGIAMLATFFVVFTIYTFWMWLSNAAHAGMNPQNGNNSY